MTATGQSLEQDAAAEMIQSLNRFVAALPLDQEADFGLAMKKIEAEIERSVEPFSGSPVVVATVKGLRVSYRMAMTEKMAALCSSKLRLSAQLAAPPK